MMPINHVRILRILAILVLLNGCLGKSVPAEFFMLEPEPRSVPTEGIEGKPRGPVIVLGPVRIAEYLDRPQIVTARSRNAYQRDENHRWAERLDDNISRVLARNLEAMVPAALVWTNAPSRGQHVDFRVPVNILEFHVEPDGQALFTAQWSIIRNGEVLQSRTSSIRAAASTTDYSRMVAGLNECVNSLSRTIARYLREFAAAGTDQPR